MLFKGLGVDRLAVALGIEIVIRGLFRIEGGIDGFRAGIADRSGRQTLVVIKVVLGIRFEILVTQLAAGASQTIQNGCIHLQIRE